MFRTWRWLAIFLPFVWLAGCGGGEVAQEEGGEEAAPAEAPADDGISRRSAESLPKVGDHLPPLDGGKVEAAPPSGWNTLPRGNKFLAGFCKGKASELPRITIVGADAPPGISAISADNCEQVGQSLMAEMNADKTKKVVEPCLPIYLGDHLFLRHVRMVRYAGTPAIIQSLQTVHEGRLYSVELMAEVEASRAEEYEASLKKYRDLGYAVAANLKFSGGGLPASAPAELAPAPAEGNP